MPSTYFKNIHNPYVEIEKLVSQVSQQQQQHDGAVSDVAAGTMERDSFQNGVSSDAAHLQSPGATDSSAQPRQAPSSSTATTTTAADAPTTTTTKDSSHHHQNDNNQQQTDLIETEFLINQMVEDLDQSHFEKLKDKMTKYDSVDGMKPNDFIALWNRLIRDKHPEKLHDEVYQQRIMDMFRQIDFDQDGRLTFQEFSSNLVACQRQSATQLGTYDETPHVVTNPHITPDKLIYVPQIHKIVSCGKPEQTALWSVRDGSLYKRLDSGHTASIHSALYIPQRETLMTCSADRTMIAYDVRTLKKKRQIPTKIAQLCMVYDSNARNLYTGGTDSNVHIWNLDDFSENRSTFRGIGPPGSSQGAHTDFVMDLCMLDDLNLLISCSLDRTIKLWDTRSFKCKHTKLGHLKGVTGLTFSQKYKLLVSYGCEKFAYMWNTLSTSCVFRFEGHSRPLIGAHIVEDTPELITCDTSGIVIIWNIRTYRAIQKLRPPNLEFARFRSVCYDSYTKQIITSGEHEMHYWKSIQSESKVGGINNPVVQLRYNRVFKQLLTGVKRFLTVWKSANGHLHKQYPVSDSNLTDFIILGQWRTAAASTVDGEIKLISLMDGNVSRSVSLKDEIRGLFLVEKELHDEEKNHLLVPTLKGDVYRVDLMKEQIDAVYKSALKNCTISGSTYSEKYKLLATISGDVIEVWKPFQPQAEHRQVYVSDDTTSCLFVDAWSCFVTIDMSGHLKLFSVPSFRHMMTVKFNLPIPARGRTQQMQNPTPLSLVHAHEKLGYLIVTSTYHVTVIHTKWLALQCQAVIDKNSITSKGQTILYRDRIIAAENAPKLEDSAKQLHAFDVKLMRLCNVQFFSTMANYQRLKSLLESAKFLKDSKFITNHYETFAPTGMESSQNSGSNTGRVSVPSSRGSSSHSQKEIPLQDCGCILMEHSTVTLEKYLKHQDLRIDEIRWLTICVVNAIEELHSNGFVVNNLSTKNIVRVDRTWKLSDLHHCVKEGEKFSKKSLPASLLSPEYAKQIQEGGLEKIVASRTHDIWCLALLMLRLTTNRVFIDETLSESAVMDKLLKGPQNGPVFSITFEDVIDVTPRNILRHILVRNSSTRWTIFQIIKHMETSGALSQQSPPVKQRILVDDSDSEDEDEEEENENMIPFPQLWDNQAYDPFMVYHNNPNIFQSNTVIISASEGKITSTCPVDDPPLFITSYFKKAYSEGWVQMYDLKGNNMGTMPNEDQTKQDSVQWVWPDVHAAAKLYYEFDIPFRRDGPRCEVMPLEAEGHGLEVDTGDGGSVDKSSSMVSSPTKKRSTHRALWQDSDSDDEALDEILGTGKRHDEDDEEKEKERQTTVRSKMNVKPKIKVTFRGRRLKNR